MKLPIPIVTLAGLIAGALEAVQRLAIPMSQQAHSSIDFVLVLLVGIGVVPLTGAALRRLIPLHAAAALTSLIGVLQVLQQTGLEVSPTVHTIIAVALSLLAAVGIVPTIPLNMFEALQRITPAATPSWAPPPTAPVKTVETATAAKAAPSVESATAATAASGGTATASLPGPQQPPKPSDPGGADAPPAPKV